MFLGLETPFPETSAQLLSGVPPALLAEDSIHFRQSLELTLAISRLLSDDRRREAQKQRCRGQPHCPAHGDLEQKEPSALPVL